MSTSCQSLDKWLLNNTIIDLILTIKHTMRFKIENNKDDFKKKKQKGIESKNWGKFGC